MSDKAVAWFEAALTAWYEAHQFRRERTPAGRLPTTGLVRARREPTGDRVDEVVRRASAIMGRAARRMPEGPSEAARRAGQAVLVGEVRGKPSARA